jgi:hypothetical protein
VPTSEFLFALQVSGAEPFGEVVDQVATNVCRHLGCSSAVVSDLVQQLGVAFARGCATGMVDVRFYATSGSLEVVVSACNEELWRASRHLS